MLALLLGVADGDAFERIDAVHAVLAWRSRKQQVTEGAAALYIAALKVGPVDFELALKIPASEGARILSQAFLVQISMVQGFAVSIESGGQLNGWVLCSVTLHHT